MSTMMKLIFGFIFNAQIEVAKVLHFLRLLHIHMSYILILALSVYL